MVSSESKEFILAEFNSLREEILARSARIRENERNALIICGAIWVWVAAGSWKTSYNLIIYIPSVLSILFALKCYAEWKFMRETGAYILKIEDLFRNENDIGWEHYLKDVKKRLIVRWSIVYWLLLVFCNFLFALLISAKIIVF